MNRYRQRLLPLIAVILPGCLGCPASAFARPMLPARELTCRIGHVINFDPGLAQRADQLRYDRVHDFALMLPAIPVRNTPPPEPDDKPDPVNPRTRILADPDGISPQPTHHFERVIDLWPQRVELSSTVHGALRSVIVVDTIDPAAATTNIVLLRATELTHFDPSNVYQGQCRIRARQATERAS